MRPIATEQNALQFPLNRLLGTAAHVRLLRILADQVAGPVSATFAAERTGLTETGARRALARLARTGFVVRVGGGRSQLFELRTDEALAKSLSALFRAERERFDELLSSVRTCLASLAEVRVAWIDALPEGTGEPLEIGLVSDPESLSWLSQELRRRIIDVEQRFDVTIEIRGFTLADAPEVSWREAILLAGIPPGERSLGAPVATHLDRERRALRISEVISHLVDKDRSVISRAVLHLDRVLADQPGAASHDLREWHAILTTYSVERLKRFLISTSSRAQRLRQSSPFFAVLTPDERDEVVAKLERGQ